MCLAEILAKVEIKDMNVKFYTDIYIGSGDTYETITFTSKQYDITSIPKSLLVAKYSKCVISDDLIIVYL